MKEFPSWSHAVTSHIASHVHIKSIRCMECCLSFESKDALMSHLYSCHSQLPKGICIDVRIENHERCHLQNKSDFTDLLSDTEALLSKEVLSAEKQQVGSEKLQDSRNVNRNENSVNRCKQGITVAESTESDKSSTMSDRSSGIEAEPIIRISLEKSNNISPSQSNNDKKDSVSFLTTKQTYQRKSCKPTMINGTECSEINSNWVEIVPATQPMTAQCSHCTFTCNTELQLKVYIHVYLQTVTVSVILFCICLQVTSVL